jgi:signal transduction histidine kinase
MTDVDFSFVGPPMLSALELLATPVAIISLDTGCPVWANASALDYWNAESLERLHPHMAAEQCSAIAEMFARSRPDPKPGERRSFILRGHTERAAGAAAVTCTGVSLHRHPKSVLVEFHRFEPTRQPTREAQQDHLILAAPATEGSTETQLADDNFFRPAGPTLLTTTQAVLIEALMICPTPALVMSPGKTTFLQANAAARQLLPIAATGIGADIAWFANAKDRHIFFEKVDRLGTFSDIMPLVARSGRTFIGALSGRLLDVDGRALILMTFQDVDGLQRASAELETALGFERALSRRQRRMLEIASHEFRTPLAVIDSTAQRIVRGADTAAPEQVQQLAERIREFVGRMGSLLDNTIERVRNNVSEIDFRPEPDQLQRAITQVAMVFEENADIELDQSIADLPQIWFDRVLIEQALINLVENAAKYSSGRARIQISATAGTHEVELLVRDWGIGIMPDERENVFAENARGRNVGRRSGTGLGLYIVDTIIRAHGGEISVEDTDGPGTTMRVVLPFRPPAAQRAETASAK